MRYKENELVNTRDFLSDFWRLRRPERVAKVITPSFDAGTSIGERFHDPQKMLKAQLDFYRFRDGLADDVIPTLNTSLGVVVFPSAFGCRVLWREDSSPAAYPLFKDDPQRVYDLSPPEVTDGYLSRVLEYSQHFIRETNGALPLRATDLQSPLGIASQVWDPTEFMIAMHTNPAEVHHLLDLCTDLLIRFVKAQRKLAREFVPFHFPPMVYMDESIGIALSDDLMAVLGPREYAEFGVPYNNRVSDEFGGIVIHSCGDFRHNLENLLKHRNLRGVNFNVTEIPMESMVETLSGRVVIITTLSAVTKIVKFNSHEEYVRHVLERRKPNTSLFIVVAARPDLPLSLEESRRLCELIGQWKGEDV